MATFILTNARWLAAGLLLVLGSGPGHVWFMSLFSDDIQKTWNLTDGEWGGIYTFSTLAAAACLFWKGGLVDTMPARRITLLMIAMFAVSCLLMAVPGPVFVLGFALFGLRFFGQIMLSHVSMTLTAKWFRYHRGRAIAIVGLGHPIAQIVWPIPVVLAITSIGPSMTWIIVAAILGLVLLPIQALLLRRERMPEGPSQLQSAQGLDNRQWTRGETMRHWLLYAILPLMMLPGIISTNTFFFQSHVASVKGWTIVQMSPGYIAFALSMIFASFLGGWIADRFGSTRLLPVFMLPVTLSLALIAPAGEVRTWFAVMALLGMTNGLSVPLWGAMLPEVFGTLNLGAIRSLTSTMSMVAVAIGPGVSGILIDRGIAYPGQAQGMAVICLSLCVLGFLIQRTLARKDPGRFGTMRPAADV